MIHDDRNRIHNIVSLVFLGLTVSCCLITGVFVLGIVPVPFVAPRPVPSLMVGDLPAELPATQPVKPPASSTAPEAVVSAAQHTAESGKTAVVSSTTPLESPTLPEVFPTATDALVTFTAQITHTVVAGDRVGALAERYGSTVEAIIAANNLDADALIIVGQTLIIPVSETVAGTHLAQVSPTPTRLPTTPSTLESPSTAIAGSSPPTSSTAKPGAGADPAESDGESGETAGQDTNGEANGSSAAGAILGLVLVGGLVAGLGYGGYRYMQARAGKGLEEEDTGPSVSRLLDLTTQAEAKQPEPQAPELEEPEPGAPKGKDGPTIRTRLLSPKRDVEDDDDFWDSLLSPDIVEDV